nr:Hsp70 family protein [Actinosynnema sp. ALI-1.44]
MTYIAGIDFGTTNSSVAVFDNGECRIVPNSVGERFTPSVAALTASGEWLVGEPAKRQAVTNAARTFSSTKLKLGTDWVAYVNDRRFTAEDIAAVILRKLKADAENYLQGTITDVVLTVPAYFDLGQRQATVGAAERAGLNVMRVVAEPTAAAMAYGMTPRQEHVVLVFDLGGGTFDVSLLEISDYSDQPDESEIGVVEVKATSGDNHLGGDTWDERIVDWLVQRFTTAHGVNLRTDAAAMRRVREAAENAKIELSSTRLTSITLPYIAPGADRDPLSLHESLSRDRFQAMTADLVERAERPIFAVLKDAEVKIEDVDDVVLVGGATRMPAIGDLVQRLTGKPPRRGLIPDGVAVGAAIQGSILHGLTKNVLLLDVTPLSLGIETTGGIFTKLIERNTTIPTKRSEIFGTAVEGQTTVRVAVHQGEQELARHNPKMAVLELTGILPDNAGAPRIEVTIDVDANGIAHVTAKDLGSGKETAVTITADTVRAAAAVPSDPNLVVKHVSPPGSQPVDLRKLMQSNQDST